LKEKGVFLVKLVVLGIDGGTLRIIKEMVAKGELPAFKQMMQEGSYGILKSLNPPVTCPLWKSYSAGKNYGKLGAFGWIDVDCKEGRMRVNTSKRFAKYREIWDYLGDEGKTSGVINMSLSFPPKKVKGFFISGNVHKPEYEYTYPMELKKEIEEKYGYKISKSKLNLSEETEAVKKETMAVLQSRFDVAKAKLDKVDFMQIVLYRTDAVMHFMWDTDFMRDAIRLIDKGLGELRQKAGKECDFIVMSDHGFRKLDWVFYSNNWLKQKGYLIEKKGAGDWFNRLGISRDFLFKLVSIIPFADWVKKRAPKSMVKTIKSKHGEIGGADAMYLIDWEKSRVISQSPGSFYINRNGSEKAEIMAKLEKELLEIVNPGTGKPVMTKLIKGEELYSGEFSELAPDLVAESANETEINGSFGPSELFNSSHHWKATHHIDGMFFMAGPSFRKGNGKASILDIMPTALHVMGTAVPTDIDGKVLEEFFAEGSSAKQKQVKTRKPLPEENTNVKTGQEDSLVRD